MSTVEQREQKFKEALDRWAKKYVDKVPDLWNELCANENIAEYLAKEFEVGSDDFFDSKRFYPGIHIEKVTDEVAREVDRATHLHKKLNSLHEARAVIEEEFDEFWDEVKINPAKLDATERDARLKHIRKELIQLAATCVRTILDCDLEK